MEANKGGRFIKPVNKMKGKFFVPVSAFKATKIGAHSVHLTEKFVCLSQCAIFYFAALHEQK